MRAYVCHPSQGLDSLKIIERQSAGALMPGQVRVAMRAASVNYRDLLVLGGKTRMPPGTELIPCSDGAGEVVETAADVWRVKTGDRVALTFSPDWIGGPWTPTPGAGGRGGAIAGVMCDELIAGQHELVRLPAHLSFQEGATLPCAGVTAWHSLCAAAPLMPGMTVLLQGGGGVSVFALQFAKLFGARVIMTTSSAERCTRLKSLGADETIDYNVETDWEKRVRALTGGEGVDLTVEVGGAQTISRSLAATRMDGRLALVGLLTGAPVSVNPFASGVTISPIKVGSRRDFEEMNRAIAFHRVHPVIAESLPFERLHDALRLLEQGRHIGKIVIDFEK